VTLKQFNELKHQKEDWRRSVKVWVDRKSRQYKNIPLNILKELKTGCRTAVKGQYML